uniref:RING-type E3 ubiquitin transferase n=1 Tax=Gallus gallus TaxID=9031 RepID=A0A8V0YLS9_CHICK
MDLEICHSWGDPDHRCPICLDTMDDASYAMPCLHRFCFGCIRRWTQSRPTCPLCNRRLRWLMSTMSPAHPSLLSLFVNRRLVGHFPL